MDLDRIQNHGLLFESPMAPPSATRGDLPVAESRCIVFFEKENMDSTGIRTCGPSLFESPMAPPSATRGDLPVAESRCIVFFEKENMDSTGFEPVAFTLQT